MSMVGGVRIVSLLPSTTEIAFAIGAGDDVVGVTFECDYPPEAATRRIVSTTALPEGLTPRQIDAEVTKRVEAGEDLYRLDEGALAHLDPDLILTQDLCAVCAVDVDNVDAAVHYLGCHANVLTVDPGTLTEVLESIETVGSATGHQQDARSVRAGLRSRLDRVAGAVADTERPRVAVLEWTDPPFTAGHWVPDMVEAAGATPVLGSSGERSMRTSWENVVASDPHIVVVAPCGYSLDPATDLAGRVCRAEQLPAGVPVWAVDANATFARPGPRLVDGVEALAGICHPDVLSARTELARRMSAPADEWAERAGAAARDTS